MKPPKGMKPEGADVNQPNSTARGFGGDSFRLYMINKIENQRRQFGVQLPPMPPRLENKKVTFHANVKALQESHGSISPNSTLSIKPQSSQMGELIRKLQKRHGRTKRRRPSWKTFSPQSIEETRYQDECIDTQQKPRTNHQPTIVTTTITKDSVRPDLFFSGVCVLINGYTSPDNETLQRMLQRYGGDVEKYETMRITHIIAQNLSMAKAKIYKNQRRPTPVCRPNWIVDSVKAQKVLPFADYLLENVKDPTVVGVNSYFTKVPEIQKPVLLVPRYTSSIVTSSLKRGREDNSCSIDNLSQNVKHLDERNLVHKTLQWPLHHSDDEDCCTQTNAFHAPQDAVDFFKDEVYQQKHPILLLNDVNNVTFSGLDNAKVENANGSDSPSSTHSCERPFKRQCSECTFTSHELLPKALQDTKYNHPDELSMCYLSDNTMDYATLNTSNCDRSEITNYSESGSNVEHVERNTNNILFTNPLDQCHGGSERDYVDEPSQNYNQRHASLLTSHSVSPDKDVVDIPLCDRDKGQNELDIDPSKSLIAGRTDSKYINGRLRTTGTDPNFLESFFQNSRLSFIGSFKQRIRNSSPRKALLPTNSTRFVFHVDMDSFFASVVLRRYPEYVDKPVVISHNGNKEGMQLPNNKMSTSECATCNYVARTFGIKKGMFLGRARKLCPDLIVLQYDFEGYEEVSEQVADILHRQAELFDGAVEQVSCDEAYMELHLSSDDGISVVEVAKNIAENLRQNIFSTTQCTATVGVGSNKFLAKLATDKAKPNGTHVVENYQHLLVSLLIRELPGIGWKLDKKLAAEGIFSVQDIWDLGDRAEGELCRILGPGVGMKILGFSQGEDIRPVQPAERRTIGAECSYGVRFDGPYCVGYMIEGLAKEIQKRMERVELRGSCVTLKVKRSKDIVKAPSKFLGCGSCNSFSRRMDFPRGTTPSNKRQEFARIGMILLGELAIPMEDIRGVGLTISKLVPSKATAFESEKSTSISSFLERSSFEPKDSQVEDVIFRHAFHASNAAGHDEHFCEIVDNPSIMALPPASQIDANVLASLPGEIRTEIEAASAKRVGNRSKRTPPIQLGDTDLEVVVPPASQLHMSQVRAMPTPIRRQIMARIQLRKVNEESHCMLQHDTNTTNHLVSEYHQVSVKRLFQLAVVKSGAKNLTGQNGDKVSMTQLDCLPLKIQLQIANNDEQGLGTSAKRKLVVSEREQQNKGHYSHHREGTLKTKNCATSVTNKPLKKCIQEPELSNEVLETEVSTFTEEPLNPRDFYLNDILPLRKWMDINADAAEEAIEHVFTFLSVCVNEGRLVDVAKLLRSIKHRSDKWNDLPFSKLVSKLDKLILTSHGKRLDLEWLGLVHDSRQRN